MNSPISEDADVPILAVKGLDKATQRAKKAGEIIVVRGNQLLKITQEGNVEVLQAVPGRRKVTVRTKKIKR